MRISRICNRACSQFDKTELSLRTVWDWSVKWDLAPLNPDKLSHFPTGQPSIALLTFSDWKAIEMVESPKEPVVSIDSSFKPSLQCKVAYARARVTVFMIRRVFAMRTQAIFWLGHGAFAPRLRSTGIAPLPPEIHQVD